MPITSESIHELPFPWQRLWPILSQTDWINRSVGLPPVGYDITPLPEGGSRVTAKARFFGLEMQWREFPFEWIEGQFYCVRREFDKGPLREANLGMEFQPVGVDSTRIRVFSHLTPRHAFGAWLARRLLAPKATQDMASILRHVSEHLRGHTLAVLPKLPKHLVSEPALQAGLAQLRQFGPRPESIARLEILLREGADVELSHLRPWAIARAWNCDRWEVLRLFLFATRTGLLNLSWEILCPNCRSSRQPQVTSLANVRREAHCEVCQIRFDAQFDQSVELKFAVHPAIRPVDGQTFCLAGPGGKPHIVSQLWLAPGEQRSCRWPALPQAHRLRSPQVKETVLLAPSASPPVPDGAPGPAEKVALPAHEEGIDLGGVRRITCHPNHFAGADGIVPDRSMDLTFVNPNPHPVLVTLEQAAWSDDILTAAMVANWQEFRDLFVREVISPDEQISVGSQIVLFTDLRGSTAMYCGIGDAPAYALVRDHFQILRQAIAEHHGAIVKTIGDAVMGVFGEVAEALAAVLQMQQALGQAQAQTPNRPPLKLKSCLHLGPCLAVNANEKLDYFGTTINLAARLVDCCQGGDVVLSEAMFQRPETKEFLSRLGRATEPLEMKFRGFEAPQKVWRIPLL